MKRIIGLFCVFIAVLVLASCSMIEGIFGKKKMEDRVVITIKYLREDGQGEDGERKYAVDSFELPLYKGEVLSDESYRLMISSRIGILQATSQDETKRYTVTKFFEGKQYGADAFDEKLNYVKPDAMPEASTLGNQIDDLRLYPARKDMTLYAYYTRAADKEYEIKIHCLNFFGKNYGDAYTDSADEIKEIIITYDIDEEMTVDTLLRKISESSDEADLTLFSGGIGGLTHYKIDKMYETNDIDGMHLMASYGHETAFVPPIDERTKEPKWIQKGKLTWDAKQEYYAGYSLDKDYERFCIVFNYLKYAEGTLTEAGTLQRTEYKVWVENECITDDESLKTIARYINDVSVPMRNIELNTSIGDYYYTGQQYGILDADIKRVGRDRTAGAFHYEIPPLREIDTLLSGTGAVGAYDTTFTNAYYPYLDPIAVKDVDDPDENMVVKKTFLDLANTYGEIDVYVIYYPNNE